MITQTLLDELKEIIKEDYRLDLPMQDVSEIAYTLVGFFESLAKVEAERLRSQTGVPGNDDLDATKNLV